MTNNRKVKMHYMRVGASAACGKPEVPMTLHQANVTCRLCLKVLEAPYFKKLLRERPERPI